MLKPLVVKEPHRQLLSLVQDDCVRTILITINIVITTSCYHHHSSSSQSQQIVGVEALVLKLS